MTGSGFASPSRTVAGPLVGLFWIVAGLWAMGLVWWAQHVAGMAPCALCLWERWPYRVLIILGVLFVVLSRAGRAVRGVLPAVAAAVAAGIPHVVVPRSNEAEARLVPGASVRGADCLAEVLAWYGAELGLAHWAGWHRSWRSLPAFLVRDALLPLIWLAAWAQSAIVWRGNAMDIRPRNAKEFRPGAA